MNKKERLVAAIQHGTVIDHIPADKTYQVASLLGLFDLKTPVTIGINYPSQKVGNKGIIKVSDKFFSDDEISRLSVVAPKELAMPNEYKIYCKEHGIQFQEHTAFNEKVIADADILYMTRVQKERFSDLMEYERVKNVYILNNDMLRLAKPNMRILHPLPRVNEIAYDVDENPHAYYIQQAGNGLFAREAIFCDVLGISLEEVKNDKTIIA